jgi:hypothetical protein
MIDDLGPLNRAALWWFFKHESSVWELARANYTTLGSKENIAISALKGRQLAVNRG